MFGPLKLVSLPTMVFVVQRQILRSLHVARPALYASRYLFYEAARQVDTSKAEREKAMSAKQRQHEYVFEGNSVSTEENIRRIQRIFGGSLLGEKAGKSSSRYFSSDPCTIAGVVIPGRPREPDNCCMSGCNNCVWELYNDDMESYRTQRRLAAEKLRQHGGIWPLKHNPPIRLLKPENLPFEIRSKSREEIAKIVADQEFMEDNSNRWESVSMLAFSDFEKRLKSGKRLKKS